MTHLERHARRLLVVKMIDEDKSIADVVAATGLSARYVCNICHDVDVKVGRPKRETAYRAIARLIGGGDHMAQIAEDLHVSRQRVHQIYNACLRHGIPVQRRDKGGRQ